MSKQHRHNVAGANPKTKTKGKKPFALPPLFSHPLILLSSLGQNKTRAYRQPFCAFGLPGQHQPVRGGTKCEHISELKLE